MNRLGMLSRLGGWRVLLSGGASHNGTQAGVTYLNANNNSGNANSNISCQLATYVTGLHYFVIHTIALAKNKSSMKVLVPHGNALGVT